MILRKLRFLSLFKNLYGCFRTNDNSVPLFRLIREMIHLGLYQDFEKHLKSDPIHKTKIESRESFPIFDSQIFQDFPEGSLGKEYAAFMLKSKVSPDFYEKLEIQDDLTYAIMRTRMYHDLWHVVTGFDVSPLGEMRIQAFIFSQTRAPISALLLGAKIIQTTLIKPRDLSAIFDAIVEGYEKGRKAKSLFAVDWRQWMSRSLSEFQQEYGLK